MADRVGQQLGNYQLLRLLGRGGFAEVYLAEHRYLEVPAAIKVLHVHLEPNTHEHFLREARTIAHLQHPHIVRVLDFGFQDQLPFLVMEYTPNGTLRMRHPKGTCLPLEHLIRYVKQIASALDYAHQQHVVHRDVKPENMLLTAHDEIVLSDFGLAVVQQSLESLSTQSQAGTPLYMAPEQIQRKPCAASDQYALGVLVYEWLCGEPPFRGSLFEVLSQHLHQPPPSLCARIPSLSQAVEDAVFGALAKDPQARFDSVKDFAEVLEEVCMATQTLSLSFHSEHLTRNQGSPSDTLAEPDSKQVLSAREEGQSSFSTQPIVRTHHRKEEREELVASEVLPLSAKSHVLSQNGSVPVSRTNRQRFLRKVRAYWITGVFEHSLHGAALLALGLQEQPNAVANPWKLVLQHPAGASRPLPAGTRITEAYDAAEGELLILGAPGSGKTTLLLELARNLLNRAEHDEQHPLPVVFNLASWASKQKPLTDWMVEELIRTYQVPRKLGQAWVDGDQILPLLDGLDEVAPKERTACIETINTYRQEHGLLPLVVCSRSGDYLAQTVRVQLGSAVMVQPLTQQQIDDYLARGGEPLRALRVAMQQDASLLELTSTPLMLSVLTLTYHDMPVKDLLPGDIAPIRQQVFEHYIERMLVRREGKAQFHPEQVVKWLTWLARQMRKHNQSEFYIEQIQPDWLLESQTHRIYEYLAMRLPDMLIGGIVSLLIITMLFRTVFSLPFALCYGIFGGLVGGLISRGNRGWPSAEYGVPPWRSLWRNITNIRYVRNGLIIGLSFGLVSGWNKGLNYGLAYGLCFGLISALLSAILERRMLERPFAKKTAWSRKNLWYQLINFGYMGIGLSVGLSYALAYTISTEIANQLHNTQSNVLAYALVYALNYTVVGILLCILLERRKPGVQPAEVIVWSWRSFWRSLVNIRHLGNGVLVGALVGLIMGLSAGLIIGFSKGLRIELAAGLSFGLITWLAFGLSYWLLLGLFSGLSSDILDKRQRVKPNQGIRRSARNSVLIGLISGILSWLICNLSYSLFFLFIYGLGPAIGVGQSVGRGFGLFVGLSVGLLFGLLNGGLACVEHYVLRLLICQAGCINWNIPNFLDYTAERILLCKIGGGYIFIHQLLLDYFASLDTGSASHEEVSRTLDISSVS